MYTKLLVPYFYVLPENDVLCITTEKLNMEKCAKHIYFSVKKAAKARDLALMAGYQEVPVEEFKKLMQ